MGVWLGPMGNTTQIKATINIGGATYNLNPGEYSSYIYKKEGKNWEIAFLTDCTLNITSISTNIDIFLVGRGQDGGSGGGSSPDYWGGAGGNGGSILTKLNKTISIGSYSITIGGIQDDVNDTSGFGFVSSDEGSEYKEGASGATIDVNYPTQGSDAGDANNGVLAFGQQNTLINPGKKYGASGGGGGVYRYANGTSYTYDNSSGGNDGGGTGGKGDPENERAGGPGQFYGAGGGGGGIATPTSYKSGGEGYQGILIIRNHRA